MQKCTDWQVRAVTRSRICSSISRIPESLKMGIHTPEEAKLYLPNRKAFQQCCPSYLKGWGAKTRFSHLCLLVVTALGDLCAQTWTLSWQCLHDMMSALIALSLWLKKSADEKTMLLFNKHEGIKIKGQSTETPQGSLIRWVKPFGATLLISSCPKNGLKTFGICVSRVVSLLTTL